MRIYQVNETGFTIFAIPYKFSEEFNGLLVYLNFTFYGTSVCEIRL